MTTTLVLIRSYRFSCGWLHLLRDGTMTDAEVADYYEAYGPILEAKNGEMPEADFYNLPEFD